MSNQPAQSLFVEAFEQDGLILARLDGVINEDNRLQDQLADANHRSILLNLSRVSRINSCGVRDWVRWVQALEARGNTLYFVQVSPALVAQINMVRNFCGSGTVLTFQAPYFCATCNKEYQETITSKSAAGATTAPPAVCQGCGEPLEFDDLPEVYFAFANEHAQREVPAEVTRNLNKFDDASLATKFAALKEISSSRPGSAAPGRPPSSAPAAAGTPRPNQGVAASEAPHKK